MNKSLIFALAFGAAMLPAFARAQTSPLPAPRNTPTPIPLSTSTPLPYPAYGTPAPAVANQVPQPGVPQSVTLPQAIAIAAAKSPVLSTARAVLAQSAGNVDLARTGLRPSIAATASTTRSNGGGGAFAGAGGGRFGGGGGFNFTSNSLTADLRQLIFDGGRVVSQIHAAQSNYGAAGATFERNYQTLAYNVAVAYYNALQAQQATLVAQQVVKQNQVQQALVTAQLRAGTASRVDLITAELPVAQARVTLVKAQGTQLQAQAAFANALGLNANTLVRPADNAQANSVTTILQTGPLSYDAAVTRALLMRPDYLAAEKTVQAQQYNLHYAKLGTFPSLSGAASYGTQSTLPNGTAFTSSGSIGLTLSIPIYDQGVTRAQTEIAQAQLDQAVGQLDQSRLNIQLNVQQALVNYVSAQAAVTQTQTELTNATEVLKATQAQYKAGVTTLPLLLNAQVGLTTAQTDELNAVYALRQAEQAYLYALGTNAP